MVCSLVPYILILIARRDNTAKRYLPLFICTTETPLELIYELNTASQSQHKPQRFRFDCLFDYPGPFRHHQDYYIMLRSLGQFMIFALITPAAIFQEVCKYSREITTSYFQRGYLKLVPQNSKQYFFFQSYCLYKILCQRKCRENYTRINIFTDNVVNHVTGLHKTGKLENSRGIFVSYPRNTYSALR